MKTFYLVILVCMCHPAFCQSDSSSTEAPARTTVTLGALYANTSNYHGQQPTVATPYTAIVGSIHFPSGIYLTALGYKLLKEKGNPFSAGSFSAGVDWNFSKNWTGDVSFAHAVYSSNTPFLQASMANTAAFVIKNTSWVETTIAADYSFGSDHDVFVDAGISKSIVLGSLFSVKDQIAIAPALTASAGTQQFYKQYVRNKILRDSIAGLPIPIGGSYVQSDTTNFSKRSFDPLSYGCKIPLSYYRQHYVVELAAEFSMLTQRAQQYKSSINSFFTFSMYYQF